VLFRSQRLQSLGSVGGPLVLPRMAYPDPGTIEHSTDDVADNFWPFLADEFDDS